MYELIQLLVLNAAKNFHFEQT